MSQLQEDEATVEQTPPPPPESVRRRPPPGKGHFFASVRDGVTTHWPTLLKIATIIALIYIFLVGIKLMGEGSEALAQGKDSFAHKMLLSADNPFIGLFIGLFVTSIVQSSGVVTSIIVALVSGGAITVHAAVPMVMGANIGTTVTNILVSMGYITRRDQFRRAVSAAVVHDFFNVLTVLVMMPLELMFGMLGRTAMWISDQLPHDSPGGAANVETFNPLGPVIDPAVHLFQRLIGSPDGPGWAAGITALVGLSFIFFALLSLVTVLRSMVLTRAESFVGKVIGKSGWMGIIIGMVVTAIVHSSSVTTSVLVPMAAAGIVTVTQVFPITIGANLGTTMTALVASLAGSVGGGMGGVAIALVHLLFNVCGLLLFYPVPMMRRIPVWLATKTGSLAAYSRKLIVLGVVCLFFVIPGVLIFIYRILSQE